MRIFGIRPTGEVIGFAASRRAGGYFRSDQIAIQSHPGNELFQMAERVIHDSNGNNNSETFGIVPGNEYSHPSLYNRIPQGSAIAMIDHFHRDIPIV